MTAFVSGTTLAPHGLPRRPRNARCDHINPPHRRQPLRFHPRPARRATPLQMCDVAETDLSRALEPASLASKQGFALRDAPVFQFAALSTDRPAFEKGGAYAIRDESGQLCYMGYSKNVAAKLLFHSDLIPDKCASFQVYVPPVPPELMSPEMLESVLEYWVRETGQVPPGNTVDRELWERPNPIDRKPEAATKEASPDAADIPIRERTTPKRVAYRERSNDVRHEDTFTEGFRASSGSNRRRRRKEASGAWDTPDDDYVEVEVDPLDPFSASKRRQSQRSGWDFQADSEEVDEDWIPIVALMGCAGLIWLLGFLSNALPAATPSLGM